MLKQILISISLVVISSSPLFAQDLVADIQSSICGGLSSISRSITEAPGKIVNTITQPLQIIQVPRIDVNQIISQVNNQLNQIKVSEAISEHRAIERLNRNMAWYVNRIQTDIKVLIRKE